MKGYFGVGVERASKAMNVGTIYRTANAFGASFVFSIAGAYTEIEGGHADTSRAPGAIPFYDFPVLESLALPEGCELVGVEITDDAVDLPSFHHPARAAYILGSERGGLSAPLLARCAHVVRIPTRFSVNVAVASAIVLYDRVTSLGRFAPRPLMPGGPVEAAPEHVFGNPRFRRKVDPFLTTPPSSRHPKEIRRTRAGQPKPDPS